MEMGAITSHYDGPPDLGSPELIEWLEHREQKRLDLEEMALIEDTSGGGLKCGRCCKMVSKAARLASYQVCQDCWEMERAEYRSMKAGGWFFFLPQQAGGKSEQDWQRWAASHEMRRGRVPREYERGTQTINRWIPTKCRSLTHVKTLLKIEGYGIKAFPLNGDWGDDVDRCVTTE